MPFGENFSSLFDDNNLFFNKFVLISLCIGIVGLLLNHNVVFINKKHSH